MSDTYKQLGIKCSELLLQVPLGSLSKRELELKLLEAAVEAEFVAPNAVELASRFQISLAKAHSYLNDLALRKPALSDSAALAALMSLLRVTEVVASDKHLLIPIGNPALRIWLERKLASNHLYSGETIRRDLVKITPLGLLRLLDGAAGISSPSDALAQLGNRLPDAEWVEIAKRNWTPETTWRDTFSTFRTIVSLAQALPSLVSFVTGG